MIEDIGVVVQGPLNHVNKIIKVYKDLPNIVVSTWNDESQNLIDELENNGIKVILNAKSNFTGKKNINLQCVSTFNGIHYLYENTDVSKVVKIRSDFFIPNIKSLLEDVCLSLKNNKISFLGYFNMEESVTFLMDFINAGTIEEMLRFWKPEINEKSGYPFPELWLQDRYFNKPRNQSWDYFFKANPPKFININRNKNLLLWLKHNWDLSDNLIRPYFTVLDGGVITTEKKSATLQTVRINKYLTPKEISEYIKNNTGPSESDWYLLLADDESLDEKFIEKISGIVSEVSNPVCSLKIETHEEGVVYEPRLIKATLPLERVLDVPVDVLPFTVQNGQKLFKPLWRMIKRFNHVQKNLTF